jgi:hypothetical protein
VPVVTQAAGSSPGRSGCLDPQPWPAVAPRSGAADDAAGAKAATIAAKSADEKLIPLSAAVSRYRRPGRPLAPREHTTMTTTCTETRTEMQFDPTR